MSCSYTQTLESLRTCRLCRDAPVYGVPLPHEPRPIFQLSSTARLCIASQAPGMRAHVSGIPFQDASGKRLRDWMGLDEATFYDAGRVAILPMGACFPGYDAAGGDRPPRRECAPTWRTTLLAGLPHLDLILLVGAHAQAWHLGSGTPKSMTERVALWRSMLEKPERPRLLPLPHPSWRNTHWIKAHPWFEAELLPFLKRDVQETLKACA